MHNVNHRLAQRVRDRHQATRSEKNHGMDLQAKESRLHQWADYCFACSDDDLDVLLSYNLNRLKGFVVPNGVDTDLCRYQKADEKGKNLGNLLFCASLTTEANIGGLLWFHEKVWPLLQQTDSSLSLTVVGNDPGDSRLDSLRRDRSLNFTGRVDSLEAWYAKAGVAICPILAGSGTRLKILEAMSFGNPVVSTAIGCEGLQALDNHHLLVRDTPEAFCNGIQELLSRPGQFQDLSLNAREFVCSRYDWNVIGSRLSEIIHRILNEKSPNGVRSRN
jgi:glycosyltransferase involved in cell wall biosynthesis